jgi:hypothetical protein
MIYKLYKDKKHTIWKREHFSIEADSELAAIVTASSGQLTPTSTEWLEDSAEEMSREDNDGYGTICIFNSEGNELYSEPNISKND